MKEDEAQGRLGMSPELAAWWGKQGDTADMGADPLQEWLGREQQARAVYKRSLAPSSSSLGGLCHCANISDCMQPVTVTTKQLHTLKLFS